MTISGFELNANILTIKKDPNAVLDYAFDWSQWLKQGDTLLEVEYSVQSRLNDPNPVVIESSGIITDKTYCYLSGGQLNKTYQVSCKVTTNNALIENRSFLVKIETRSA